MKSIVAYSALLLASLSSMVSADLGVGPLPKSINSGEEVDVKYWMGEEYAVLAGRKRTRFHPDDQRNPANASTIGI